MTDVINRDKILEMVMNREIEVEDAVDKMNHMADSAKEDGDGLFFCEENWEEKDIIEENENIKFEQNVFFISNDSTFIEKMRTEKIMADENSYIILENHSREMTGDSCHIQYSCEKAYEQIRVAADKYGCNTLTVVFYQCINAEELREKLHESIYPVFFLCKGLLKNTKKEKIRFIYLYQDIPDAHVAAGAVAAFLKSVRAEQPRFFPRCINVPRMENKDNGQYCRLAEIISQELETKDSVAEVCYAVQGRLIRRLRVIEDVKSELQESVIQEDGIYMITGGTGKLAHILAEYLGRKYRARIILVGRRELSEKEKKRIEQYNDREIHAEYHRCDITECKSVMELMNLVNRQYGKINGIFHAAGILKDSFLFHKEKEELDAVFEAKVYGTEVLLQCAEQEKLDFVLLFSSISAQIGNIGQCDYAYANAVMDRMAEVKQNGVCRVVSVAFPLWEEGGMQIDERARIAMKQAYGLQPLPNEEGMAAVEMALRQLKPLITVLYGERDTICKKMLSIGEEMQNGRGEAKLQKVIAEDGCKEQYQKQTVDYLKKVLAKVTKIREDDIDENESFEYYGMDSITAMSIGEELEQEFGELSKTLLFEYQNLNQLAEYFLDKHYERLRIVLNIDDEEQQATKEIALDTPETYDETELFWERPDEAKENCFDEEIAIIGLSGRYPGADTLDEFWENLKNGEDSITLVPRERWHYEDYYAKENGKFGTTRCKWGGFIRDMDKFDPLFFNISPNEACLMDPQERLFLETAWHAIEDAGYSRKYLNTNKVGVYVGVMYGQYQLLPAMVNGYNLGHTSIYASIANRVSYYLNLSGPSVAMDTMCSSSLTSLHMACSAIKNQECDLAIAGGVNISIHPDKYIFLSQGNFTSEQGYCKSFGEGGDGYVPSEGVGAVLLKPLKGAVRDHDHIYAVIKGSALNHGGKTSGYTVPNPAAQSVVIKDALNRSHIDPRSISYIEAHGTGTSLGDPIEIRGLINSIGEMVKDRQFCAIGSVKSNIGHAESAAGIAGVTKILLQMKYRLLVPSIHLDVINSKIDFESTPFYLERTLEDWNPKEYPRRAGISSFGAGGANAHILFEEYRQSQILRKRDDEEALIVLSAKSREQLKEYAAEIARSVSYQRKNGVEFSLRDIAYTLQVGREEMAYRMAVVVDNLEELLAVLESYSQSEQNGDGIFENKVNRNDKQKLENSDNLQKVEKALLLKNLKSIAECWVSGIEIDWLSLYQEDMPYHVSLVGYPFKRERYWIPEGENEVRELGVLHPLVHRNLSTVYGVKYQTDLNRNLPFYMDETYIQNNGRSAMLGILLQAAMFATEDCVAEISEIEMTDDLEWSKDATVNVEVSADGKRLVERIVGEKSRRVYAGCVLKTQEKTQVDEEVLREEAQQAQSRLQDVQMWEEGVEFRTYHDEDIMLLEMCSSFEDTRKYHNLPMLFDFMGYMLSGDRTSVVSMEKIQIFRKLDGVSSILKKTEQDRTTDFYLFDQDFNLVFSVIGCDFEDDEFDGVLLEIIRQVENGELDVAYAEELMNGLI